ncbi:MAG TPA: FtsX-like permease family protein, partial [Bryobacteraceae bacterium]|nr:FtsX-like permease family protein [Bryobacteraceae bacterium]
AKAELSALQAKIDASHPDLPRKMGILMTRLQDDNMRFVRTSILTLAGAVVFVLLIACANVAGLLLGRTSARRRELAVRAALGSGRRRLVAQMLTESLLLASMGMALGLLLAYAGVHGFVAMNPFGQLPPDSIAIDGRAMAFAVALVFATTLLFGAAPAFKAARIDPGEFLKSRSATGAIRMRSGQSLLAIIQIALSLMLLTGAALMGKTLVKLAAQSLGYRTDQVTVAQLTLPASRYGGHPDRISQFDDQMLANVAALPGVQASAIGSVRPPATGPGIYVNVEGQASPAQMAIPKYYQQIVTANFFDTLSIPLIAGRKFTERDNADSPPVAIISDLLAHDLFAGTQPIGRRIQIRKNGPWLRIVGVVGATRTIFYNTLEAKPTPYVFVPARQSEQPAFFPMRAEVFLFMRGAAGAVTMPVIRRQVDAVDRDVPVGDFMPLAQMVAETTAQPRMRTGLVAGFAGAALLLAAIGIYGLIAQNTAQRTGEIGIRMSLGARPGDVLTMVLRQVLAIALAGIALGIVGGLALARLLSGFLYGIEATDPAVYGAVAIAVICAASAAAYFPARRAARVDPTVALRYE